MTFSPALRAEELAGRLRALAARPVRHALFVPSAESDGLRYFPDTLGGDLAAVGRDPWRIACRTAAAPPDVVLTPVHGRNGAGALAVLRQRFPDALLGAWFWDNHLGAVRNLTAALGADLLFPSHHCVAAYLANPLSVQAGHVPLACSQWTAVHARRALELGGRPRGDRAYAGYVDYPDSPRSGLLAAMRAAAPEIDVVTMPPGDRSRYFTKDPFARLDEWLAYPVSVVLPVNRDLSTRFFDGLLAGHVPVIADDVADLDAVVSPAEQAELPVVKFRAGDLADLRRAVRDALEKFAAGGAAGVRHRQTFAGTKHLTAHRVLKMLRIVSLAAEGRLRPLVHDDPESGPGLFLEP